MSFLPGHPAIFDTLKRAIKNGDAALMDCRDRRTGESVAVVCAVNRSDGECEMAPLARLFNGNPYDELDPPRPASEGGGYEGDAPAKPERGAHTRGQLLYVVADGLWDTEGRRVAAIRYASGLKISSKIPPEENLANGHRLALAWNHHDDLIAMVRQLVAAVETPGDLADGERRDLCTDALDLARTAEGGAYA